MRKVEVTPTEARQGEKSGRIRIVLGVSLAAAVAGLLALLFYFI